MECATISELADSLSTRFETAKTAFRLHVSAGRDAEEVSEMMAHVTDIQRGLRDLRAAVDQEKAHLEFAQATLASLRVERARVEHLMANLPSRLPSLQAEQKAAANSAAQTNGVGKPASGSSRPGTAASSNGEKPAPSIAYLTVDEFNAVPQYMRGRGTRDQSNKLLEELNSVIAARYALMRRPRSELSGAQRKLWMECKREENPKTKGSLFFTEEDFKRFKKSSLSKAMRQLLVVLRHVGRISSLREGGAVVRHVLT
ncbi:Spindle and kinetochore-associated protein 1 [Amphibalanus amphitrite]|uniref:SKA complex subunit 1 n=1 Tax=Amphibalanus amphitrite TaxID=1232801 RepID=A0A6A4W7M3_AMPAM|nr:Spindle and kinetochore-associated protein 1 [Amphibalanus amphitrite]KAF0297881.1 Spindle and kinetochore-associated protein 1 [Amphibalanus amphitrite]